jgi:N-acetylmuramate 1-kinase
MSSEREASLNALLAGVGWDGARREALAGDASTRRYERLHLDGRTAILMDAPKSAESGPCPPDADEAQRLRLGWNAVSRLAASRVEAFLAVGAHLKAIGLSAPEVIAADAPSGFALLEDLGDDLFAKVIPGQAAEAQLYGEAGKVLAHAQAMPAPAVLNGAGGPWPLLAYDALALRANADLFAEWLPQATDVAISDAQHGRFEGLRDSLIAQAEQFPRAFTIRDYHAENLLWLPNREGLRVVGLLDYQDALLGWRGWDLSMLLHDARRDVSPFAASAALGAYLSASGASEREIRTELAVLGALNIMRILGLFARLSARDGKPRYLGFMPRMWGHLAGVLQHPDLAGMAELVEDVAHDYIRAAA